MPSKKSTVITVFQTSDQATAGLARYGELDREIAQIENELATQVAQLRKDADARIAPLQTELTTTLLGLEAYAKSVRPTLSAGQKTIRLSTGDLGWRIGKRTVVLRGKAEDIIARIKAISATYAKKYIRTKESINRPALLADQPEIEGIKYALGKERFYVTAQSDVGTAKAVIEPS
jgi:phage host-nuclease inhibitor protein Gam